MNHALGNIAIGMLLGYALARGMSRRQEAAAANDSARPLTDDAAPTTTAAAPGPGALYPGGRAGAQKSDQSGDVLIARG